METKVLLCFHCLRLLLVVDKILEVSIPTGGCGNDDRRDDERPEGDIVLLRMTGMVAITVGAFRRTTGRCEEDDTEGGAVIDRCVDACGDFETGGSLHNQKKVRSISVCAPGRELVKNSHVPFHNGRLDFLGRYLGNPAGVL